MVWNGVNLGRAMASVISLVRLVALALMIQISGVPTLIVELAEIHDDCCETPCEGADDEGHCPPNCQYGNCAKTHTALLQVSALLVGEAPQPIQVIELTEATAAPAGVRRGVFHPPRA
jgi:hypothetical protein